jgi:Fe-S cluster assembly ATP-binding protein
MLNIQQLSASILDETGQPQQILKALNLQVRPGSLHVLMGPNGSGKSSLAQVLIRNPLYTVDSGSLTYAGHDLLPCTPDACAHLGIFLSFQAPIAIDGISNLQFLKAALNAKRKAAALPLLDAVDCLQLIKSKADSLGMSEEMLYRGVNHNFSGGERKLNEILQMAVLQPQLVILDEIDAGLDVDALKKISQYLLAYRAQHPSMSMLLITHYQRLLEYIQPDYVHVMLAGSIMHSGGVELARALEADGYGSLYAML